MQLPHTLPCRGHAVTTHCTTHRGHAVATFFTIHRGHAVTTHWTIHRGHAVTTHCTIHRGHTVATHCTIHRGHAVTTLFTIHRGFLTGKYKRGQLPAEGRLAWSAKNDKFKLEAAPAWSILDTDRNWTILDTAEKIAKARGSCQHRGIIIIIVIGNL